MARDCRKVRLCLDFENVADLAQWVDEAKDVGALSVVAEVFTTDALDFEPAHGGVDSSSTYIVRGRGARPDKDRLNIEGV